MLAPGERVLAFTDGISELVLPNGRTLGLRTLSRFFASTHGMSIEDATRTLAERIDGARQDAGQDDDMTFVIAGLVP